MKKSKILAPALAILCLSTAASVTGTVAWFAANNTVSATGMLVQTDRPSSLAISEDPTVGTDISVAFAAATEALNSASHLGSAGESSDGSLSYVQNGDSIDPATGLAKIVESVPLPLTYVSAPSTGYYRDYTVYIGSIGESITLGSGGKLVANVAFTNASGTTLATSMDFHVALGLKTANSGSIGSYKGYANAAMLDTAENHGGYDATAVIDNSVELLSFIDAEHPVTIPQAAASEPNGLKVTMRIYIDGALQEDATHAFVRTNVVNYSDVNMAVSFTLTRGNQN